MILRTEVKDLKWYLKIWHFLSKIFLITIFKLRFYPINSKIHRFFYDRKWDKVKLTEFTSLQELIDWMRGFTWKQDSLTELWDAICTPQKVQAVGRGDSPHGNDCDEAGIYVSNSIQSMIERGVCPEMKKAYLFTVTWMELNGAPSGHNSCLIEYSDGTFAFMDYKRPSEKRASIPEVADLVRGTYSGWNSVGHGMAKYVGHVYMVSDPRTLKPIIVAGK